jgi:hypothetical protein
MELGRVCCQLETFVEVSQGRLSTRLSGDVRDVEDGNGIRTQIAANLPSRGPEYSLEREMGCDQAMVRARKQFLGLVDVAA